MADQENKDPVLRDETYVGVVPPAEDKPAKGEILRSKEEMEGSKAEGPKVIPPAEDKPEPKVLVSQEEAALNEGEVSFDGPQVLAPSDHDKAQQEIAASNSPQVADAPPAPLVAEPVEPTEEAPKSEKAEKKADKKE